MYIDMYMHTCECTCSNEEQQSSSDVSMVTQWFTQICERIHAMASNVQNRFANAFSCKSIHACIHMYVQIVTVYLQPINQYIPCVGICSEIHAHHHQTSLLLTKNKQLAEAMELMREVTSGGSSDRVVEIFETHQKRLIDTQQQLVHMRSIFKKYTSNLSCSSSNFPVTETAVPHSNDPPSVEIDTREATSSLSVISTATSECERLIDNERSLQFARLSILSEKKTLESKINGGGLHPKEIKALTFRLKKIDACIHEYDSRILTTKEEYEIIRGMNLYVYIYI